MLRHARNHYIAVRRMQEPQLHHDKKQEEAYRAFGNEEILQYVPQANGAQGSEIVFGGAAGWTGFEFRGVVQRLGLRSPKPGMGVRIPPPLPELSVRAEWGASVVSGSGLLPAWSK